jgi:hypothetical protein
MAIRAEEEPGRSAVRDIVAAEFDTGGTLAAKSGTLRFDSAFKEL